ncbi:MAG TPA: serine/threonine-protein kinase [Bacteroidia bacterium]|nr:serine/threonine-protein kinase [Bacteroidia bacterium]
MGKLLLSGKLDHYLFDPENESTVLKKNGRFGNVYAGARLSDKTMVVIKHLNPALKNHNIAVEQFQLESNLQLEHVALRKTFEFIHTENEYFLVQEYLTGIDLKSFFKVHKNLKNKLSFILHSAIEILDALNYIHTKNIFHCDIKPSNILVKHNIKKAPIHNKPEAKLIDFGLAKIPGSDFVDRVKPFSLIYSPPEQALHFHELVNASSDLFALGTTIYELITGKNPYGSTHPEVIMHWQVAGDIEENELIPKPLFKILQKAVAKAKFQLPPNQMNKEDQKAIVAEGMKKRFQNAIEMKAEIENFLILYNEKKPWLKNIFG